MADFPYCEVRVYAEIQLIIIPFFYIFFRTIYIDIHLRFRDKKYQLDPNRSYFFSKVARKREKYPGEFQHDECGG